MSYTANSAWEGEQRKFSATITVRDGSSTSHSFTSEVKGFTLEESLANDTITMGLCNSAKMSISFKDVAPSDRIAFKKGNRVSVVLGVSSIVNGSTASATKTYPYMYIDDVEIIDTVHKNSNGDHYADISIVCYDAISKMDDEYEQYGSLTQAPTVAQIVDDICDRFGLESGGNWSSSITISELPENCSYRQILGYLAGLVGRNAHILSDGALGASFYTDISKTITKVIEQEEQYLDGFNFENDVTVTTLESGTQNNVLTASNGQVGAVISFENPLMTQSVLSGLFTYRITSSGLSYSPCKVKWTGNPQIEIGDKLKVKDKDDVEHTVLIMKQVLHYDGSIYEEIECLADKEVSIAFNPSPTMRKLERKLVRFEEAIIAATKAITQLDGSEFKLIPSTSDPNKASGWCLKCGNYDNAIVASAGGIGFGSFTNGDFSATNAAIFFTTDSHGNTIGQINGQKIVAGSIDSEQINSEAITADKIHSGAITTSKISAGAITTSEIDANGLNASVIKAGILQSTDGKTYFDLNNSVIKTVTSAYNTSLSGGGLITKDSGNNVVGGLVGSNGFTAGNSETLYFESRLFIGEGSNPGSGFDPYFDLVNDKIYALKDATVKDITADDIYADSIKTSGGYFSGISHANTLVGKTVKLGVGTVNYSGRGTYNSSALELRNSSDSTMCARLDITDTWGTACGVLTFYNGTRSAPLELGTSAMWFNGNQISSNSSEKYKKDISLYNDSALSLVDESEIYSFKYKDDGDEAITKYGLIIERECPSEVIDNSGDAISLYSMTSILWKAVKELSEKVKGLGDDANA